MMIKTAVYETIATIHSGCVGKIGNHDSAKASTYRAMDMPCAKNSGMPMLLLIC